jgi:hypothetical protein
MKKYVAFIFMAMCLACAKKAEDIGPEDSPKLEVSRETVKLSNQQSQYTLTVESNMGWTVAVGTDHEWLTTTIEGGHGDGSFQIIATDNTQGALRTGKLIVSSSNGAIKKEITVEQLGAGPDILLSYPTNELTASGGEFVVIVTANVEWEAIIEPQYTWIKPKQAETGLKSFSTNESRFDIEPNGDQKREGKIVFKSIGEFQIIKTVTIVQNYGEAYLEVSRDEYVLPYKCGTLRVPINTENSGVKYLATSTQGWMVWDEASSDNATLTLSIQDNDQSDFPRSGEITVVSGAIRKVIRIFQYGKPNPRIGDDMSAAVLAFPGAEGGGRFTTGGRGGTIYRVTNLLDYAKGQTPIAGSLRYGLDLAKPRVIVFEVSGTIELQRRLGIVQPNVSIIGQTAPGDGITLKNYQLEIGSNINNVIIRFIRCRTGDARSDHEDDGISGRWFKDGIIDHVSASWSVDECVSFYGVGNFTVQWVISSESLNNSMHGKGAHGYGGMFSGDNASMHHVLMAHHGSRCPRISDLADGGPTLPNDYCGYFDVRNNVYYNWSGSGFGCYGGKNATFNLVNSYYKAGPATTRRQTRIISSDPSARIFADGNYATANPSIVGDNWTIGIWNEFYSTLNPTEEEKQAMKKTEAFPFGKVTTHTPADAYQKVALYAGASLRRDAVDKRLVNELLAGTTTYTGSIDATKPGIIDKVSDTDGYPELKSLPADVDTDKDGIPDIWEQAYGLNKDNASDALSFELDNTGRYSNLEVYFHNLVQHIVFYQNEGGVAMSKE